MIVVRTLADHYGGYNVSASCNACRRFSPLDMPALAKAFGWDAPLGDVKPRLRCSGCGSKDVGLSIAGVSDPDGTEHRARRAVIESSRAGGGQG